MTPSRRITTKTSSINQNEILFAQITHPWGEIKPNRVRSDPRQQHQRMIPLRCLQIPTRSKVQQSAENKSKFQFDKRIAKSRDLRRRPVSPESEPPLGARNRRVVELISGANLRLLSVLHGRRGGDGHGERPLWRASAGSHGAEKGRRLPFPPSPAAAERRGGVVGWEGRDRRGEGGADVTVVENKHRKPVRAIRGALSFYSLITAFLSLLINVNFFYTSTIVSTCPVIGRHADSPLGPTLCVN